MRHEIGVGACGGRLCGSYIKMCKNYRREIVVQLQAHNLQRSLSLIPLSLVGRFLNSGWITPFFYLMQFRSEFPTENTLKKTRAMSAIYQGSPGTAM